MWLAHRLRRSKDKDARDGKREPAPSSSTSSTTSKRIKCLPRKFDGIFREHGRGIPIPYLRALAWGESRFTPSAPGGLLTVVEVVLRDYNQRHGTRYTKADLNDPKTNVMIAADTLRVIVDSYARTHPDVPALREDWSSRPFLEAVTFGWNGGYSNAPQGGVGRVVSFLKSRGDLDITLDKLHKHAHEAGASQWLWAHPKKVAWTRSVVDLYFAQLALDGPDDARPNAQAQPAGGAR
jgi:hypothetical protein